eukprot:CAMPEP_0198469578 /NCGR_PEP_ID=MMETSP1456-20131121/13868_1 /TAXON_ID=1461544 ORGANISM="Unidentified sp., Strain RCC1871" /NCGR_SAMPLE_ID=MMETSP1456 /ASSEMBLY_ACC=CAM_ASM_001119 /LENGTH=67 /DNA_ID=CAMNT_0044195995 /DNA_START=791 /DNA_END=994 /DNA_ORIENTATION=+
MCEQKLAEGAPAHEIQQKVVRAVARHEEDVADQVGERDDPGAPVRVVPRYFMERPGATIIIPRVAKP